MGRISARLNEIEARRGWIRARAPPSVRSGSRPYARMGAVSMVTAGPGLSFAVARCRYITRPAISIERLPLITQGNVLHRLKIPLPRWHHGCRVRATRTYAPDGRSQRRRRETTSGETTRNNGSAKPRGRVTDFGKRTPSFRESVGVQRCLSLRCSIALLSGRMPPFSVLSTGATLKSTP
jgi:hypothetical protein